MATLRKLVVEVVEATNLKPKDGLGTSSPYVVVDFRGQRQRTETRIRTLSPVWNQELKFDAEAPPGVLCQDLEAVVCHDLNVGPTTRNNFLGRIAVSPRHFVTKGEEAVVHYTLERKSFLSWVRGEIALKIYYVDEEVPPPPPQQPAVEDVKAENGPPSAVEGSPPEAEHQQNKRKTETYGSTPPPAEKPASEVPPTLPAVAEDPKPSDAPKDREDRPASPPARVLPEAQSNETETSSEKVQLTPPPPVVQSVPRSDGCESFVSELPEKLPVIGKCSIDLVDKMHYLFVRVVKARSLPSGADPFVGIAVSGRRVTTKACRKRSSLFEWDQTFAFAQDDSAVAPSSAVLEVSVWDPPQKFLGGVCFDASDTPLRDPPDSPLAPQWYRLEGGGASSGDLMLATWVGTQADEAFPDAWKTDAAGTTNTNSKIYLSPKLWYLRATVIEAQEVLPFAAAKDLFLQVKARMGFQVMKTRAKLAPPLGSPSWNEDLMFVASDTSSGRITFELESRQPKGWVVLGEAAVPLAAIERRVDNRQVASQCYDLEERGAEGRRAHKGKVHLRLCFDGGYHVMDEPAHVCSDYRPTARQLWKPAVGTVELGIVGCRGVVPTKTVAGKGSADAYAVAKYGAKWVRTRTVRGSLEPRWNEQYTWQVFDPCTVLTVGVMDSWEAVVSDGSEDATHLRIGRVRVRISTLEAGRTYRDTYPLLQLTPAGLKRTGEIELAVRFLRPGPVLDILHLYSQPLLPLMHHVRPLGVAQQEALRSAAVRIVAAQLSRSEPPLRPEVVLYLLDAEPQGFSMRRVRANWRRIVGVAAGAVGAVRWVDGTRAWRSRTGTVLVHAVMVLLVWFPDLILPALAFYASWVGAWNFRLRRSRRPAMDQLCPVISMAEAADQEELEEEFDGVPSGRSGNAVRSRYDKLRALGVRVQTMLGDVASQGERAQAVVTWRDPRGSGIFVGLCFVGAVVLYVVPLRTVALASGFYYFRHPIFRDRKPSPVVNFFRRLPSLSDQVI